MLLYLVRHGETQSNLQNRIQGQSDTELTELGVLQAQRVADHLKDVTFDAIYSSDLGRAVRTAQIVSNAAGVCVTADQRLRERNFGVLQGLTLPEAAAKFPAQANQWRKNDPAMRMPQGESTLDVLERCRSFLDFLKSEHHDDSTLCIVAHGGSLRSILLAATGIPAQFGRVFAFSNAGVSVLQIGEKVAIKLINETAHVKNV